MNRRFEVFAVTFLLFTLPGCEIVGLYINVLTDGAINRVSTAFECMGYDDVSDFTVSFRGFEYEEVKEIQVEHLRDGKTLDTFLLHPALEIINNGMGNRQLSLDYMATIQSKIMLRGQDSLRMIVPPHEKYILSNIRMGAKEEWFINQHVATFKCRISDYSIDDRKFTNETYGFGTAWGLPLDNVVVTKRGYVPEEGMDIVSKILEESDRILRSSDKLTHEDIDALVKINENGLELFRLTGAIEFETYSDEYYKAQSIRKDIESLDASDEKGKYALLEQIARIYHHALKTNYELSKNKQEHSKE